MSFHAQANILVVEDDEDIFELVNYKLRREGYNVTSVITDEEGLRLARETSPDLLLLDLMLPGIDGLLVCRILKEDTSTHHIPIILLTARGEAEDIAAG